MGDNPFKLQERMREQNHPERPEPLAAGAPARPGGVGLPEPKPKRGQCSLYLDVEMMERVKRVARKRGVTIGAVIEACVKMALDQLEV